MQLNEIQEIVDELKELEQNSFTPYGATKVVNRAFSINLPPQMLYNYSKKGYVKATIVDGRWLIKKNDLIDWVSTYAVRNLLTL